MNLVRASDFCLATLSLVSSPSFKPTFWASSWLAHVERQKLSLFSLKQKEKTKKSFSECLQIGRRREFGEESWQNGLRWRGAWRDFSHIMSLTDAQLFAASLHTINRLPLISRATVWPFPLSRDKWMQNSRGRTCEWLRRGNVGVFVATMRNKSPDLSCRVNSWPGERWGWLGGGHYFAGTATKASNVELDTTQPV